MSDLNARAAITDLIYTYALNIRKGCGVDCGALFTDDAIFEVIDADFGARETLRVRSSVKGRDAITSHLAQASGGTTRVCPTIHNLLIQVDGFQATSSCVMTSVVWPDGQRIVGEYQDSYAFDTVWRFTARRFSMFSEPAKTR
jgi:hypothetical protein